MSPLTWLLWGLMSIALLNAVALMALVVAYVWHHGLKPRFAHRRARQRTFERLIAYTMLDNHPPMSMRSNGH